MILKSGDHGDAKGVTSLGHYIACGEIMWTNTEQLAGITVRNDSLGLELSLYLVSFLKETFGSSSEYFLARHSLCVEDLSGFVLHDGASRMIIAAAESLGIDDQRLENSRAVLRDFGNLSACSVLFVLEKTIRAGASGRHLMAAFEPGFTMSFLLLDLQETERFEQKRVPNPIRE